MAIFDRISELADSHRKPNNRLLKNLIVCLQSFEFFVRNAKAWSSSHLRIKKKSTCFPIILMN